MALLEQRSRFEATIRQLEGQLSVAQAQTLKQNDRGAKMRSAHERCVATKGGVSWGGGVSLEAMAEKWERQSCAAHMSDAWPFKVVWWVKSLCRGWLCSLAGLRSENRASKDSKAKRSHVVLLHMACLKEGRIAGVLNGANRMRALIMPCML